MENTPVGPGQTYEHGSRPGRLACQLCSQEFAASERKAHEIAQELEKRATIARDG